MCEMLFELFSVFLGLLSVMFIFKRWNTSKPPGVEDLDKLLLDNLETFDKTAGVTKHNNPSSPPYYHESNHLHSPTAPGDTEQIGRNSKPQLAGYQTARFSSRPHFSDIEEVKKDAESDIRDIARDLKSELIRDSEKMLQDIETLYDDHISHYEGDFVTKSDDLCDALSKIDALNIKEENKQFLIRSMEPEPYYNPLEPPKYHAEPNKIDPNSEKHSTLKTLMAKRRQFGTGPSTRIFDKPESAWKPTGQIKSPPHSRDHPLDVVKGETIDAYADFKRGAMSPQERVLENIKNLREGDDEVHQVMPSKAKMPRYAPQEADEPLQRPRGIFTRKLLEEQIIKEPPKPMILPEHATPAPFTYMNSTAPIADLADIKAYKKMSNEPTNPDVSDDTPLTNGVKRGSVKNLAKMFNRCMSPEKGDRIKYQSKRERHRSEGFAKMEGFKPLARSRSLVFDDEDRTGRKSIRTCISTNDLTCSTKYDDNTDRDVDTSIMDDTSDSKLFNDRMLINHNYSHGIHNGKEMEDDDEIDGDDCPSSASLSRAVSPVPMARRNKDYKNRAAKRAAEEKRMRFSTDLRNDSFNRSDESILGSIDYERDESPHKPAKTLTSNFKAKQIPKKFERKTRFTNIDVNIEETKLLSTIMSEPTPPQTVSSKPNPSNIVRLSTQINGTEPLIEPYHTTTRTSSHLNTSPPIPPKPTSVTTTSNPPPVLTTTRIPTITTIKPSTRNSGNPTSLSYTKPFEQIPSARQTSENTNKSQSMTPKEPLPLLYRSRNVNFDMSKPPTFSGSDTDLAASGADQTVDLNSSQSSCGSLKENECLNQYRVEVGRNRITEEESASSGKDGAGEDKPLTLVSNNHHNEEKLPFSISEYQKMFKEKQQQKKPESPVAGLTRKRFMRQSSQQSPHKTTDTTSHTLHPHNASSQKPRGLVKSSSVQESRVLNQG